MSDCCCDYKMRMTYHLEAGREGDVSDCGCDYETCTVTTYGLKERVGDRSVHRCDHKRGHV